MTDNTKVFNMDCMEAMRNTPDKYYDLAVVDPPYGINAGKMTMGSGKHKFAKGKDWDSSTPNEVYFNELFRVSKNQIIWGGNYFTEYLKPTPHWIVWDKKNPNLFEEFNPKFEEFFNNLVYNIEMQYSLPDLAEELL